MRRRRPAMRRRPPSNYSTTTCRRLRRCTRWPRRARLRRSGARSSTASLRVTRILVRLADRARDLVAIERVLANRVRAVGILEPVKQCLRLREHLDVADPLAVLAAAPVDVVVLEEQVELLARDAGGLVRRGALRTILRMRCLDLAAE